jgi:hypothetical protein
VPADPGTTRQQALKETPAMTDTPSMRERMLAG